MSLALRQLRWANPNARIELAQSCQRCAASLGDEKKECSQDGAICCINCVSECARCHSYLCVACRKAHPNRIVLASDGGAQMLKCPACSGLDSMGCSINRYRPRRTSVDEEFYALEEIARKGRERNDTRTLGLVRQRGDEFFQRHPEYKGSCFDGEFYDLVK